MAIDILFILMVSYGFYFGYVYGPIKAFLFVLSLLVALVAAMRFTPLTVQLIRDTFEVDSPFMPFLGFTLTLLGVLMVARLISQLLLETINNQKFNLVSQVIGGLLVSVIFVFLFSVLVKFFSNAHVINPEVAQRTSFFYKFIEKIPDNGRLLLKESTPFVEQFIEYMENALKRMENGDRRPRLKTYSNTPGHIENPDDSTWLDSTNTTPIDTTFTEPEPQPETSPDSNSTE